MSGRRAGDAHQALEQQLSRGNGRTFVALTFAAAIPVLLLSGWVATLLAQQQRDLGRSAAEASARRTAVIDAAACGARRPPRARRRRSRP